MQLCTFVLLLSSCSIQHQLSRSATRIVLQDSSLKNAHVGISVYDPAAGKYLYNYNGEKYFVPASNTKIASCYAALKYLGDSLPGIQYIDDGQNIQLIPTGDPSLLHPDYKIQPVIDFLKAAQKPVFVSDASWKTDALGAGWSWGDFNSYYMAERSPLPVYGNTLLWVQEKTGDTANKNAEFDQSVLIYSIPEVNWKVRFNPDSSTKAFYVQRQKDANVFTISQGTEKKKEQWVPFVTNGLHSAIELLKDTIHKEIEIRNDGIPATNKPVTIYSQPTDSLLKPLMHRSDNFFAEQVLMMASFNKMGVLSEDSIINLMLKTDLAVLPQLPSWADGSGLSRYNLFSPQDFVVLLNKMQVEFGIDRLKQIFPTGGSGTLRNFYKQDSTFIYAKTGTLTGVVALSGFLYTKKNRLLIFSTLINNHKGNAVAIRRKVEEFIHDLRMKY